MKKGMEVFKEKVYTEFLGYLNGADAQVRSIAALLNHELERMTPSLEKRKVVLAAIADVEASRSGTLTQMREVFDKWGALGEFWRFERLYAMRIFCRMSKRLEEVARYGN